MNNGGFNQFSYDSAGDRAKSTAAALRSSQRIGLLTERRCLGTQRIRLLLGRCASFCEDLKQSVGSDGISAPEANIRLPELEVGAVDTPIIQLKDQLAARPRP